MNTKLIHTYATLLDVALHLLERLEVLRKCRRELGRDRLESFFGVVEIAEGVLEKVGGYDFEVGRRFQWFEPS